VILYALADYSLSEHQTIETFLTREEAQAAVEAVLADEPGVGRPDQSDRARVGGR